jgi:hypothetical protein
VSAVRFDLRYPEQLTARLEALQEAYGLPSLNAVMCMALTKGTECLEAWALTPEEKPCPTE